jgi:cardiolipin synthase
MDWWQFVALAFIAWFTLVFLFTPRIDYHVTVPLRPDSDEFVYVLQSACQAAIHRHNRVDIFTNGAQFYPAIRDAILAAESSINLEAYIFQPGEAADMLVDAMIARAAAGVEVRVVLDAIGSSALRNSAARRLSANGCRVAFYQPVTWYRLHRLNNRTHREILVVDGRVAFTGGAGVADWWCRPVHGPTWRDTMARIEGPLAAAIQGTFAENWLEACGEILTGPRHWPEIAPAGHAGAMLVKSSPADRATASRVVFQMLMEGAVTSIDISTPYFLPDRAFRRALVRAAQRGVRVRVIVPGRLTDQRWVRLASRRMYRELLAGGVRIFEYRPSMTHVKTVMVDGVWAMIGTTNIDNRSFEHNDEINVAFREHGVTARLLDDFESDLAASDEITLDLWIRRPLFEKVVGPVCWILERQQ